MDIYDIYANVILFLNYIQHIVGISVLLFLLSNVFTDILESAITLHL